MQIVAVRWNWSFTTAPVAAKRASPRASRVSRGSSVLVTRVAMPLKFIEDKALSFEIVRPVGIEAMSFHRPVYVGDQVSCYCNTLRIGRTSIAVHVEAWARRRLRVEREQMLKVTEGVFTFVALNDDGTKRLVPPEAA